MRLGDLNSWVKILGGAALLGLGACSTTQTVKVSKAAPITYKVGQGSPQYASLTDPSPERLETPAYRQETPRVQTQAPAPVRPAPQQPRVAELPRYDLSGIDRQLYKHQKVGKPYKVLGKKYTPKHDPDYNETGIASWYGDKFHGKPTANGEIYDKTALTAAHKTLPLNSFVVVTNLETGKTLKLRLNDRGPFVGGRIIDLSEAAANALGIKGKGLGKVRVQYAGPADPSDRGKRFASPEPVEPAPQQVVEDVREERSEPKSLSQDAYRPLREQSAPVAGLPDADPYARVPNILTPTPRNVSETPDLDPQVSLPQLPAIPKARPENEDNSVTTLTIKGPIHMAKSETEDEAPKWIAAVHRVEKTVQK